MLSPTALKDLVGVGNLTKPITPYPHQALQKSQFFLLHRFFLKGKYIHEEKQIIQNNSKKGLGEKKKFQSVSISVSETALVFVLIYRAQHSTTQLTAVDREKGQ